MKLDLRLTVSERDLWAAAARERGIGLSAFIRGAVTELMGSVVPGREAANGGLTEPPAFRPAVSTNRGPYERSFKPDFGARLKKEGKR